MFHTTKYKNSYIHMQAWPEDGYKEHFSFTVPNHSSFNAKSNRAAKIRITKIEKMLKSLYGDNFFDCYPNKLPSIQIT
jgi:hypothetical protein